MSMLMLQSECVTYRFICNMESNSSCHFLRISTLSLVILVFFKYLCAGTWVTGSVGGGGEESCFELQKL